MRAGQVLELFATKGLNPDSVHWTRLRTGEGLVGTVAARVRPLNLSEASSHPQFSYRPETGEEAYHSLLGVPVIRGGRVRGVLVIQNRARRHYTDEEVEALEVISVVVAELIAGGDLVSSIETATTQGNAILPTRLEGIQITAAWQWARPYFICPAFQCRECLLRIPIGNRIDWPRRCCRCTARSMTCSKPPKPHRVASTKTCCNPIATLQRTVVGYAVSARRSMAD